tara:strand:- start:961 stop:1254 length:294 start_codon:yes stop_codon:yes gene_type:complete
MGRKKKVPAAPEKLGRVEKGKGKCPTCLAENVVVFTDDRHMIDEGIAEEMRVDRCEVCLSIPAIDTYFSNRMRNHQDNIIPAIAQATNFIISKLSKK